MQMNRPSAAQLEQAAARGDEMAMLQLGNHLISSNQPGTTQCQRGLELLQKTAGGTQGPAAQWLLGSFYLHNPLLPDAIPTAGHWLEKAAGSRVGLAVDRLANLCLRGVAFDYQPERALQLLKQLADAGYQHSAWEVGYLTSTLDEILDAQASVTAFARACALGYPLAYYSLGLRFGYGAGVEKDLAFARALLLFAADNDIPDAREAADELAPEASYGDQASLWSEQLKKNHVATGAFRQKLSGSFIVPEQRNVMVDQLEAQFAKIDHPSVILSDSGRLQIKVNNRHTLRALPSDWNWVCQEPRVATSAEFITREERVHTLRMISGAMMPPEQYSNLGVRGSAESQFFNGAGMIFGTINSDTIVRCIERRISTITDWDMEAIDPCSVISYKPGQEYRTHVDYLEEQEIAANRDQLADFGGQRVATFLICLQAADRGGETVYPEADVSVKHVKGSATIHYNVLPDGKPDPMSLHRGWPVEAGEKWLLRTGLREHTRYPVNSG